MRLSYGGPMGDTHLREIDGVELFADDRIESGDRVLMLLAPAHYRAKGAGVQGSVALNPVLQRA